LTEWYFSW